MTILYLYGTRGCHLCEMAEALIRPLLDPRYNLAVVEISDSEELTERYGVRIPVVKRADTGAEIGWPFDLAGLQTFLHQ